MEKRYKCILFLMLLITKAVSAQLTNTTTTPYIYSSYNPKTTGSVAPEKGQQVINIQSIFQHKLDDLDLEELKRGGIQANINNGGEVIMSVYLYDPKSSDGKGLLYYQCYTKEQNAENTWKEYSYNRNVVSPLNQDNHILIPYTDMKSNFQNGNWPGNECLKSNSKTLNYTTLAIGVGASSFAACQYMKWSGTPGCLLGAIAGAAITYFSNVEDYLMGTGNINSGLEIPVENLKCIADKTLNSPIIVEISVKNATVNKIKIPLVMDEIDLKRLDDQTYVYYNFITIPTTELTAKITHKTTNDNGELITNTYNVTDILPNINAKLGDKLTFEITTDSPNPPHFDGLPSVWIARTAGEVLYYCSPSINPGDYKPFLGFDSQIHGTVIRKYPEEWNNMPKEKEMTSHKEGGKYVHTWSYIASREMNANKIDYVPAIIWPKFSKNIPGSQNPQRDNQREGINMELLASSSDIIFTAQNFPNLGKINLKQSKYNFQIDPDEIIYCNSINYDTKNHALSTVNQGLVTVSDEPWKKIIEDINKPALNLMVDAYIKSKGVYTKSYDGYEIQDIGTSITYPNGTGKNVKAPGLITISSGGMQLQFKMNVKNQFTEGNTNLGGFYDNIIGTQWPAINEKNVPYTFTGFKGINSKLIANIDIRYEHENELGQLIINKQIPENSNIANIASTGNYKVNFNMQGWGYHSITAYYILDPLDQDCKAVPIAGKELLDIGLRFVNIDNGKYIDPKDGAYIYLDNYYDKNAADMTVQKYGRHLDRYNREYTFNPEDKINLTIFDSDPHTFHLPIDPKKSKIDNNCQYETDFYSSLRTQAKRIPADTLSIGALRSIKDAHGKVIKTGVFPYLNTYLTPLDSKEQVFFYMKKDEHGNGLEERRLLYASGNIIKDKSFPMVNKGRLNELESVYREISSVSHLVNVESYAPLTLTNGQTISDTPIGKIETTSLENQILAVNLDTLKLINKTLKLNLTEKELSSRYILAQTRFVYSETMFKDGGNYNDDGCGLYEDGTKNGVWPRSYTNFNHKNRFAKYNDFNYNVKWYIANEDNTNEQPIINTHEINTFMTNYFDDTDIGYKSWFPKDWIRHYSDKGGLYPLDMATQTGDEKKLLYLNNNLDILIDNIFSRKKEANALVEPWQVRLPWIAWTEDGPRSRTNIKTILNKDVFFDATNGAFSGNPTIPGNNYESYQRNAFLKLFNDDQNFAKYNYYEFKKGRRILFDSKFINNTNTNKNYLLKAYLIDPNDPSNRKLIDCKYIKLGPDPAPLSTIPFYYGADLSYANQMEDRGTIYKSTYHKPDTQMPSDNIYDQFSKTGHNIIRVRLWVDPSWVKKIYSTNPKIPNPSIPLYSGIEDVKKTIRRAKEKNMQVLLNIQYSDLFTDPEKNFVPYKFKDINSIENLEQAVFDYTTEVFKDLNNTKISDTDNGNLLPDMVQVGNEINIGMFFQPDAKTIAIVEGEENENKTQYYTHPTLNPTFPQCGIGDFHNLDGTITKMNTPENYIKFGKVVNSGMKAIRDFYNEINIPPIPIMIHIANTKDIDLVYSSFEKQAGITSCDVIGISYYPNDAPQTAVTHIGGIISYLKNKYKKNIIIVETGETWTSGSEDTYQNRLPGSPTDTDEKLLNYMLELKSQVIKGGGCGIFYWSPELVSNKNFKDLWGTGSSRENATFYGFRTPPTSDIHYANKAITWPYAQKENSAGKNADLDDASQIIVDNKIKILEIPDQDQGIMVHPNPASTQFTIQFEKPMNNVELQLIDLQGRVVDYIKLGNGAKSYNIPINNFLPSSIYFVKVITDQGVFKKELIIKRY